MGAAPEFATLRRLMEARMLKMGRREYVQVLRLLETFGMEDLHAAVRKVRIPRHPAGDSTGIRPPAPRSAGHPRLRACEAVFHCGVFPRWSMALS